MARRIRKRQTGGRWLRVLLVALVLVWDVFIPECVRFSQFLRMEIQHFLEMDREKKRGGGVVIRAILSIFFWLLEKKTTANFSIF